MTQHNPPLRLIVYTALLGGYDLPRPAPVGETSEIETRFLCFTDGSAGSGWEQIRCDATDTLDARIRRARYFKTQPHKVLPTHDVSIWIDANLELTTSPLLLLDALGISDIATFAYPSTYGERDCIYQEAAACVERGKDDPMVIERHIARYRTEGYPCHSGLVETSIVVRRNNASSQVFNDCWWAEIVGGSRRDQLSFNYVAWVLNQPYSLLAGSRQWNPYAKYYSHLVKVYGGG